MRRTLLLSITLTLAACTGTVASTEAPLAAPSTDPAAATVERSGPAPTPVPALAVAPPSTLIVPVGQEGQEQLVRVDRTGVGLAEPAPAPASP